VHARETGDSYVRITVLLAAVLFLVAIGQRFELRGVRVGVLVLAGSLLTLALAVISTLPRI
jgi:hypothetical protein